ncbi:DUF5691 domain-containing protein [Nocardioides sp.]|uniref:DUF5691 domain-containing protein n=1 Tax=Nocardioides sp. TaxID=35761 RepID=UPI002C41019D|nr:DUF5691 domain-containing protein [Nocardioides sp.]HXH79804.1 DUF5691 domain-containing protein [Nocardioides sp.]
MSDVDAWWRELTTAALIGTSRRPVPDLPDLGYAARAGASPEVLALDAAALGAALRHAGRLPQTRPETDAAQADSRPVAPARAVQLLDLVLAQPPAGARNRSALVEHWLRTADEGGCRVPHRLLPSILDLATEQGSLRGPALKSLDARGRWLAELNPVWGWALGGDGSPADAVEGWTFDSARLERDWDELSSVDRGVALQACRRVDPGAARELVLTSWAVDGAKDRLASIAALRVGLGPDDEELLESALDDRAGSVRDTAQGLLDGLPGSRRAERMRARLVPLVRATGLLKRGLEVDLPDDPDPAGVRDGLGKPPGRRSQRGWWLEQLAAGAPLAVWTDMSGVGASATVERLADEDALAGIRRATVARRDAEWATALIDKRWDPALLAVIGHVERERIVAKRLSPKLKPGELTQLVEALPGPWSSEVSRDVVRALAQQEDPLHVLSASGSRLAENLHPDTVSDLTRWLERKGHPSGVETRLRNLIQFQSVKSSITEAFR